MAAGHVDSDAHPAGPVEGGRTGERSHARPADQPQGQPTVHDPASSPQYAWFPTTYAEMQALLLNGQLSRRVRLVPADVIQRIRQMVQEQSATAKKNINDLDLDKKALYKRIGKDRKGPWSNFKRIAWRVAASLGTIAYLTLTTPAAPAVFVGMIFGATWLYVHQHYLRKWRGFDDERVLKAIERRDEKHLRIPFDDKAVRQRAARIGLWGFFLAFSPVGFMFETLARTERNVRLRGMKRGYERKRKQIEQQSAAASAKIERIASEAAKSTVYELPQNVSASAAAYDTYFHNAASPPAPAAMPAMASAASAAGDALDDPKRRRRTGRSF